MPDKHPKSADLEKAREIVSQYGTFIGPAGTMHENVAKAVADGIALGRKEGIAMVAAAVARLINGEIDA